MRITTLNVHGLKGSHRDLELAKLNLVVGPVGAGKTTISDAIRFAAQGCVPSIGRDAASTARLMSDSAMSVTVRLEDGRHWTRGLKKTAKSLRGDAACSWSESPRQTDHANAIRALFGRDDTEAAESLDLRQLLNCSANERAKRIEALIDSSGLSATEAADLAEALAVLRLSGVDPDRMPKAPQSAVAAAAGSRELIDEAIRAAIDEVLPVSRENVTLEGVAQAAARAKREKLDAQAAERQAIAARAELEDAGEVSDEPVADLEASRRAAADRLAVARREAETARAQAAERARLSAVLPALREQAETAKTALTEALDKLPLAAEKRREAQPAMPAEIAAPEAVEPDPAEMAEADRLETLAEELERRATKVEVPEQIDVSVGWANLQLAEKRHARAAESPWREVEAIVGRLACIVETGDKKDEDLERLRTLAMTHGGDMEDAQDELDKANAAWNALSRRRADLATLIEEAHRERDTLREEAAEARRKAREIIKADAARVKAENDRRRTAYADQVAERTVVVDRIQAGWESVEREAKAIEARARQAQEAADRTAAELSQAEARLEGLESVAIVDQAVDLDALSREIGEMDATIEKARTGAMRRREMQRLQGEAERLGAVRESWAAVEWALQRVRSQDLADRAGGLEERMAKFLAGASRSETPYLRVERGVCDFGWKRDGREISVETLSGGESCIFTAALAAAVISLRAPTVRCLLIEGAELGSAEPAQAILRGCQSIADELDLVIVATNASIDAPDGWSTIECGAEAVA